MGLKKKKLWIVGVVFLLFFFALACRNIWAPVQKQANEAEGRFLLRNLAIAEQTYSAVHGGGGQKNFTSDVNELSKHASEKMIGAMRSPGKKEVPWGGYYIVISEKTKGDAFQTDYLATAYPAKGYTGKTMQISKDEKIMTTGEEK